jgi:RNA polymerase sigma-70 factor (ECF subfamily)
MPTLQDATPHLQYGASPRIDHLLALYDQHSDSARTLASRLLYDRMEAEDVVQEVFLALWRKPDCFDPTRGTTRAWLLTVVRNRSIDHWRRRVPRENVDDLAERLPDPGARAAYDELETSTRTDQLSRLVDALPGFQAEMIRRAYANGQSHVQIASETGLPLGTVKSRIRLGLEKLRYSMIEHATLEDVDGWIPGLAAGGGRHCRLA